MLKLKAHSGFHDLFLNIRFLTPVDNFTKGHFSPRPIIDDSTQSLRIEQQ